MAASNGGSEGCVEWGGGMVGTIARARGRVDDEKNRGVAERCVAWMGETPQEA